MSLLVLGLSHRSAPLELLELVALSSERAAQLADTVHRAESVGEAVVVATCNRVEVYADAVTFHGAVSEIGEALSRATSVPMERLREHLYVHYEDRAIAHLFSVACGLDSMAVGEGQILGQLREALRSAQRQQSISSILGDLFQHALRVGKRAHVETEIDRVSGSLIEAGLERAGTTLGPLSQQRVLVVGAVGRELIAADSVVVAAGQVPHDPVSGALVSRGLPSVVVGGARDTAGLNAVRAFDEGLLAASELLSR